MSDRTLTAADVRALARTFDCLIDALAPVLVALLILTVVARSQEPRA